MRATRHKVTFENPVDQQIIVWAQLGIGNRAIMQRADRSDSQVTYRLAKAKRVFGLGVGFRVNWRNGNHPLLQTILSDYSGVLVKEIERSIVPKLIHPTPKTVKEPKPKSISAAKVAKILAGKLKRAK